MFPPDRNPIEASPRTGGTCIHRCTSSAGKNNLTASVYQLRCGMATGLRILANRSRRESNPHLRFRKPPFYPLNYGNKQKGKVRRMVRLSRRLRTLPKLWHGRRTALAVDIRFSLRGRNCIRFRSRTSEALCSKSHTKPRTRLGIRSADAFGLGKSNQTNKEKQFPLAFLATPFCGNAKKVF